MARLLVPMSMLSLLSMGAIFGFFYAWVCLTMWGLDAAEPGVAIQAMQAMNASVRNPVFFPVFFLTPVLLVLTAFIAARQNRGGAAALFLAGAAIYVAGSYKPQGLPVFHRVPAPGPKPVRSIVDATCPARPRLYRRRCGSDGHLCRTRSKGCAISE